MIKTINLRDLNNVTRLSSKELDRNLSLTECLSLYVKNNNIDLYQGNYLVVDNYVYILNPKDHSEARRFTLTNNTEFMIDSNVSYFDYFNNNIMLDSHNMTLAKLYEIKNLKRTYTERDDIRAGGAYKMTLDTVMTVYEEKIDSSISIDLYLAQYRAVFKILVNDIIKDKVELGKVNSDIFFFKEELTIFDGMIPYRKFNNTWNRQDPSNFDAREAIAIRKKNISMGVESPTFKGFEGMKYTFGVEIETVGGRVPEEDSTHINVKTVHDGSLRGPNGEDPLGAEYVSGVLVGDTGLNQLHEICRVLSKHCSIDKRAGVHVHIGNLDWNKEDIVFAYALGELIEGELFQALPKSRRDNSYCRPLTPIIGEKIFLLNNLGSKARELKIDDLYDLVLREVAYAGTGVNTREYISTSLLSRNNNHPKGSKCGYDKKSQRYCWLNFVTLLFNTKGAANSHTLEIRNHGATLNYKKISNWLKLAFAFCNYVENHKTDIVLKRYSLSDIIMSAFPKTGNNLVNYINERKSLFSTHGEAVDYIDQVPSKKTIKEVVCA